MRHDRLLSQENTILTLRMGDFMKGNNNLFKG